MSKKTQRQGNLAKRKDRERRSREDANALAPRGRLDMQPTREFYLGPPCYARGPQWWFFPAVMVLLGLVLLYFSGLGERPYRPPNSLDLSGPKEVFRSTGGLVDVWSSDFNVLPNTGKAKVGPLAYPWEQSAHVRSVGKGDVIAIPRGIGHWWYNDGDKRCVVFCVTDASNGVNRGEFDSFYLAGGSAKEWGSGVLNGFDEELLSHAWDVDTDVVKRIKESQKSTVIVKVREHLEFPFNSGSIGGRESEEISENYTYNIVKAQPDVDVRNGGSFSLLASNKLPILREVWLAIICLKLSLARLCFLGGKE